MPTLLFRVGGAVYGCDIADAREIIPLRPMTRLPGAPAFVRGLINMRGTIVTVLDLGARLDPSRGPTTDGSILLVRHRERLVGLIVDEVADVRVLDIDGDGDAGVGAGAGAGTGAGSASGTPGIVRGVATATGLSGGDDAAGTAHAVIVLDLDALIRQVLLS